MDIDEDICANPPDAEMQGVTDNIPGAMVVNSFSPAASNCNSELQQLQKKLSDCMVINHSEFYLFLRI